MTASPKVVYASAPGKVVLCGEYAVLDGAPAICLAVNRRARVTAVVTGQAEHTVVAPGHCEEERRFRVVDGRFDWLDAGDEFELLECLWRASGFRADSGLTLVLDTSGFLDRPTGAKTGIGSSAALAVALAGALHELNDTGGEPLDAAHRGHLDFQNGLGSGVDIASAYAGGLIEFTMKSELAVPLPMPQRLDCRLLWSGSPASTGKKLERYTKHGARPSRAALDYSARRMAAAWRDGETTALLREYRDYVRVLQEFSSDHALGIFDAGHASLVDAAADAGLVYKPCGAGGGDIGMVIGADSQAIEDFLATALPPSFEVLDLAIDPAGLRVTREPH